MPTQAHVAVDAVAGATLADRRRREIVMRAFVTGATGFLGSRLVTRLLQHGNEVHALLRPAAEAPAEWASAAASAQLVLHRGSLAEIGQLAGILGSCDTVYHAASALTGGAATLFMNNVVSMRTLLDACTASGTGRLVLVSSLAVYGTKSLRKWAVLDEHCSLDPEPHRRDLYTYSKVAQEQVCWEAATRHGVRLVVVRPGVIYGPGRDCLTARVGLKFGRVVVRLGANHPLPYTHVANCADAVLLAGTVPDIEAQAFNIVDDETPTAKQLLRRYRRNVGPLRVLGVPSWAIRPLSAACEGYHRWSRGQLPAVLTAYKSDAMWKPLRYSNAKAKSRLGWTPCIGADDGMASTFASLRSQHGT
jgi:nucleoside-diphosphate-sugar epimerase